MIWFVEKNIRAAWVVHGALGIRQYYCYSKKEACKKYREECGKTIIS